MLCYAYICFKHIGTKYNIFNLFRIKWQSIKLLFSLRYGSEILSTICIQYVYIHTAKSSIFRFNVILCKYI